MNIGTSLKTISKNQLCSFIGTGGYVELAENDILSDGSIVTAAAALPLLNSRNDKGEGILPPGYQRVEFLETGGSQCIKVPHKFNDLTGMQMKVTPLTNTDSTYNWPFAEYLNIDGVYRGNRFDCYSTGFQSFLSSNGVKVFSFDTPATDPPFEFSYNYKNSRKVTANGVTDPRDIYVLDSIVEGKTVVFGITWDWLNERQNAFSFAGRYYYISLSQGEEITRDLIPALDTDGTPCMFDTVQKQPFYNKGWWGDPFRIGIATLQQVRELQLPDNTGNAVKTLYLSLPQEARTDFTAQKHLSDLTDLNWSINAQYRDGDIPADYTKVDFLESSGAQNIAVPAPDLEATKERWNVETDMQFLGATAKIGFNNRGGLSWGLYANNTIGVNATTSGMQISVDEPFKRYIIVYSTKVYDSRWDITLEVNGEKISPRVGNGAPPTEYKYGIFKTFYESSASIIKPIRVWSCKCECDSVSYDLIPVINTAGVPGMWDTVGKQFYENSGTGDFIAGIKTLNDARMLNNALPAVPEGSTYSITLSLPVEASTDAPAQKALKDLAARRWSITVQYREDEIPAGYAKVAFLESSGAQYIDTGVVTDGNYTIEVKFKPNATGINWLCGRQNTWNNSGYVGDSLIYYFNTDERVYLWLGVRYYVLPKDAYTFNIVWKESSNNIAINGESLRLTPITNGTRDTSNPTNKSYYLFRPNGYITASSPIIYSFSAWNEKDEKVIDLLPVLDTNGTPGMYDKVSKQFFKNDGTGQFRVGLASKEAVRNLYLEPNVAAGTTIDLSVPAGTTNEDTDTLKDNNPNYTFNIQYRS